MRLNQFTFSKVGSKCLFAVAFIGACAFAAEEGNVFSLKIEVPKQEFEVGETIEVVSRLRNITDNAIEVQRGNPPQAANEFAVRLLSHGFEIPIGLTQFGVSFRDPFLKFLSVGGYSFRAGVEEVRQWDVNRHYEMSAPGTYRLSQYLDIWIRGTPRKTLRLLSNDLTVTVKTKVEPK